MQQHVFEGIGTRWEVLYEAKGKDDSDFHDALALDIQQVVDEFDTQYSRFRMDSLVYRLYRSEKKSHTLPAEFADILAFGQQLKELTNGRFDPAVGMTLESMGYDADYSFQGQNELVKPGAWQLDGNVLTVEKPVLIDIGGWGKGYLIDLVAKELEKHGIKHYLVNGGGDVYGTEKADGSPFKVALEHPDDTGQAIGIVELSHSALASSGTSRRQFGKYHHLLDARTQTPATTVAGVYVLGSTAAEADGAATALFVANDTRRDLEDGLSISYLLIPSDLSYDTSKGFTAKIFSSSD